MSVSLTGFEGITWSDSTWMITSGRLCSSPGKRPGPASIRFNAMTADGDRALPDIWGDIAKALFKFRFQRSSQAMSSQRSFVAAIGWVWLSADQLNVSFRALNKEVLDNACRLISNHYKASTAYNLHKFVSEFTDQCDANMLCNNHLGYRFSGMNRPDVSDSRQQRRLDDPEVLKTTAAKMVSLDVLKSLGILFQDLPKDHNCRIYVVMLTFLAFLGRRFSELALIPFQDVGVDVNGERYIYTFPGKASRGDAYNPIERVALPSEAETIILECIEEFAFISKGPRETAIEMRKVGGPDLRFLESYDSAFKFYVDDLRLLGLPNIVGVNGWARRQGLTISDPDKLTSQGIKPANPSHYVTKETVVAYCNSLYKGVYTELLKVDGSNKKVLPRGYVTATLYWTVFRSVQYVCFWSYNSCDV